MGTVPGVNLSPRVAVLVQFLLFEGALLGIAAVYGLWTAVLPGTVAVLVATTGSVAMHRIGATVRAASPSAAYRQLLFRSRLEVVLGVISFCALLTYLFTIDGTGGSLIERLLGPEPPAAAVFLTLLVLWDLCYRIGTGWWASVVALWRSKTCEQTDASAAALRRADQTTMAFGVVQLALVPFLIGDPLLLGAVAGHVLAVVLVAGLAAVWTRST
jgi:hypothetical protein